MPDIDFFSVVERLHTFQNPTSERKLDLLIRYCGIADGMRVLDIGCGKAWLLRRIAARHAIHGIGVERHAGFADEAIAHIRRAPGRGAVEIVTTPAAQFPSAPGAFDVALCIGASFAIGSFEDMIAWLRPFVTSGGVLAIGDIYARKLPVPAESAAHFSGGAHRTLKGSIDALEQAGLSIIGLIDSSLDDWDEYESLHWIAADAWLRANRDHPDRAWFAARHEAFRRAHLAFDRDALGWAIWVCRAD